MDLRELCKLVECHRPLVHNLCNFFEVISHCVTNYIHIIKRVKKFFDER